MAFPEIVANKALVSCGRCCCICHKFCGTKIELHHIRQRAFGGEDTFENCIPLCFDCHSDMGRGDPKHPKGKRYTEQELRHHRDNWYKRIESFLDKNDNVRIYKSDVELFNQICDAFPETVRFWLSDVSIAGYHRMDAFLPLEIVFNDTLHEDPFMQFINVDAEELRCKLKDSVLKFLSFRAFNTFPSPSMGNDWQVTRFWLLTHGGYGMDPSKRKIYEQEAQQLDDLAMSVWVSYGEFVMQCRRILDI